MDGELRIAVDDPRRPEVRGLLATHLAQSHELTPAEHVHALDLDGLLDPAVTLFTARRDGELIATGALRRLDGAHVEVKSMHTAAGERRRGVGRAVLDHLLAVAAQRGYTRVSLETGTMDAFSPARSLYAGAGFRECAPFRDYTRNPYSVCMTLEIPAPGVTDPVAAVAPALARLFPPSMRTCVRAVGGDVEPGPHPEEWLAVQGAAPARRAQFLAGRACAHDAVVALGVAGGPIGVGAHREPLGPDGVAGSITHTRSLAAAVVAHAERVWGVGVDLEVLGETLAGGLRRRLFTPAEVERLAAQEKVEPAAPLVAFSAKECVYKCVFPRAGVRPAFQDVDVRLDLRERR
ncbi:MAG TPA: GNAT family N-acetyltransferase, partial [Candidatus Dormibacteraeota bacterium]|nr:GNAT family N-acetyltransferase [Candidatus Dormibacteraeota bacterium]